MSVTRLRDTCVTVQQHHITHAPTPRCVSVIRLLCHCISLQSSLQSPVCPSDVKNYTDTDNDCAAVISFPKYSPHMCCCGCCSLVPGSTRSFYSTPHVMTPLASHRQLRWKAESSFLSLSWQVTGFSEYVICDNYLKMGSVVKRQLSVRFKVNNQASSSTLKTRDFPEILKLLKQILAFSQTPQCYTPSIYPDSNPHLHPHPAVVNLLNAVLIVIYCRGRGMRGDQSGRLSVVGIPLSYTRVTLW